MVDSCIVVHALHTTFVCHRGTMASHVVKWYYASNFHSIVRLNRILHVCVLVSRNVSYRLTWNFYSVSSNWKLSSPLNLVSFHSFVAAYEFGETYFRDDPRISSLLPSSVVLFQIRILKCGCGNPKSNKHPWHFGIFANCSYKNSTFWHSITHPTEFSPPKIWYRNPRPRRGFTSRKLITTLPIPFFN